MVSKNVKIEKTGNKKNETVKMIISGDFTIDNADEIKHDLLKNIAGTKSINLVIDEISNIDLTALQLIYALEKSLLNKDIAFSLKVNLPEELLKLVQHAGFEKFTTN